MAVFENKEQIMNRLSALEKYNAWESQNPCNIEGAKAISAVGDLYNLIPAQFRSRPVDPGGIIKMHRMFSHLRAGYEHP